MLLCALQAFWEALVQATTEINWPADDSILEEEESNEEADECEVNASLLSLCHSFEILVTKESVLIGINFHIISLKRAVALVFMWEKPVVGKHEASGGKMEGNSYFDPLHWLDWNVLVESGGPCIELKKKPFVDPVQDKVEDAGEWVKDGKTGRVKENTPQVGIVLSVNVVTSNLITCIELVQILLHNLFRVDIAFSITSWLFPKLFLAASIAPSPAELDWREQQFGDMGCDDLEQQGKAEGFADLRIPGWIEIGVLPVEYWKEP